MSRSDIEYSQSLPVTLDLETKIYQVTRNRKDPDWVGARVSSADLLYRLRCFFPEVDICSGGIDGYKTIWGAVLHHNPSSMRLLFSESKASALIGYSRHYAYQGTYDNVDGQFAKHTLSESFLTDVVRLLNAFLEATVGNRPSVYYHPAAIVDSCGNDKCYIAVPDVALIDRIEEDKYKAAYNPWKFVEKPDMDTSSFRSLLQGLKYDIVSRKIDRLNGTTNLTTVISSALLFYRLVCKYTDTGRLDHRDINQVHPITSVWQVQLFHRKTRACVIFMDDHGLFDIRADEDAKEVMEDIEVLVEGLCSDVCTHPYDGVLAGCIA